VVVADVCRCPILLSFWLFHRLRFAIVLPLDEQEACQRFKYLNIKDNRGRREGIIHAL